MAVAVRRTLVMKDDDDTGYGQPVRSVRSI